MQPQYVGLKVDANQGAIVRALRQIPGVTVEIGHDDILVGYLGMTHWYEIKRDSKAPSRKRQKRLERDWTGHYRVVWTLEQILEDLGIAGTG